MMTFMACCAENTWDSSSSAEVVLVKVSLVGWAIADVIDRLHVL